MYVSCLGHVDVLKGGSVSCGHQNFKSLDFLVDVINGWPLSVKPLIMAHGNIFICMSVCLCVYVSMCLYQAVCGSVCLFACPSLEVCLPMCWSLLMFICLSDANAVAKFGVCSYETLLRVG